MRTWTLLGLVAMTMTSCTQSNGPLKGPVAVDKGDHKYVTITVDNFDKEVLQSDKPVLLDFWAPWCGPCKAIAPTVEQLAVEYDGKLKVGKVDIDENEAIAKKYKVDAIPVLLLLNKGEEVNRILGAVPKEKMVELINSAK